MTFLHALVEVPMEESVGTSPIVNAVVVLSFIFVSLGLSLGRHALAQRGREFFQVRRRGNMFDLPERRDMWMGSVLMFQLCAMLSVVTFYCFCGNGLLDAGNGFSKPILLYAVFFAACFAIKFAAYKVLGWVFYDKTSANIIVSSYKTILFYDSFAVFALAVVFVYLDFDNSALQFLLVALLIINKSLLLYKWLKVFSYGKVARLQIISQFCTLEIIPCFLIYKALVDLNLLM